jgi:hypothetical protein
VERDADIPRGDRERSRAFAGVGGNNDEIVHTDEALASPAEESADDVAMVDDHVDAHFVLEELAH